MSWFNDLLADVKTLSEDLGLDEMSHLKLREFVFEKAKEQYKFGNASGILWARKNPVPSNK